MNAYSISAGLDYPGIRPEHAYLVTIYEEKPAKVKAETKIIKYVADKLNMEYIVVYETYKKSKKDIFSRDKNDPNRNNRTKWYEETLNRLDCSSICF